MVFTLVFALSGFFFVKSVFNEGSEVDVDIKRSEKDVPEIKPAKVTLAVPATNSEYEITLDNQSSVLDLLEQLRSQQGFTFEKVAYISGTELKTVNNLPVNDAVVWVVRVHDDTGASKVINKIEDYKLVDGAKYSVISKATVFTDTSD